LCSPYCAELTKALFASEVYCSADDVVSHDEIDGSAVKWGDASVRYYSVATPCFSDLHEYDCVAAGMALFGKDEGADGGADGGANGGANGSAVTPCDEFDGVTNMDSVTCSDACQGAINNVFDSCSSGDMTMWSGGYSDFAASNMIKSAFGTCELPEIDVVIPDDGTSCVDAVMSYSMQCGMSMGGGVDDDDADWVSGDDGVNRFLEGVVSRGASGDSADAVVDGDDDDDDPFVPLLECSSGCKQFSAKLMDGTYCNDDDVVQQPTEDDDDVEGSTFGDLKYMLALMMPGCFEGIHTGMECFNALGPIMAMSSVDDDSISEYSGPCEEFTKNGPDAVCSEYCQSTIDNVFDTCQDDDNVFGTPWKDVSFTMITSLSAMTPTCVLPDTGPLTCQQAGMLVFMGVGDEETGDEGMGDCKGAQTDCSDACKELIDTLLDGKTCKAGDVLVPDMGDGATDFPGQMMAEGQLKAMLPACFADSDEPVIIRSCEEAAMQLMFGKPCASSKKKDTCQPECAAFIKEMNDFYCEEGDVLVTGEAYYSRFTLELALIEEVDLGACAAGPEKFKPETCMDVFQMYMLHTIEPEAGVCASSSGDTCTQPCQDTINLMLKDQLCWDGALASIDAKNGKKQAYTTMLAKMVLPTTTPSCDFPFPSADDLADKIEEERTAAPTMSPIRTIVEAEVGLTMTLDTWEKKGEAAFKKGLSQSIGCSQDDITINKVTEKAGRRRVLRVLSASKLDVDFSVDITSQVDNEKKAQLHADPTKAEKSIEKTIVSDLVAEVSTSLKSSELTEVLSEETGETVTVSVLAEPEDTAVNIKAGIHDQSSDNGFWYDCYENPDEGFERCQFVYGPAAVFLLGVLCCGFSCLYCACSPTERKARKERKLARLKSSRNGREFEMPNLRDSSMSSASPDDFSHINPMPSNNNRPASSPKAKVKSDWIELVDEGSGRTYFENLKTGETSWYAPKEGYRNRLSLLAEKKRTGGA
jgi:hypothetical protein